MSETDLHDIAQEILLDYLADDIEFSVVYEDDRAADLTEDEQRKIYAYLIRASYTVHLPDVIE